MATINNPVIRKTYEVEVIVRDKSLPETTEDTIPAPDLTPCIKPLSFYSPAEIVEIARSGKHVEYFRIGDTTDIPLLNGETLTIAIAGFNHDKDVNGNILPITFTAVNVLEKDVSGTEKFKALEEYFTTLIPEEWRKIIVRTDKGKDSYNLFYFSEIEVVGKMVYSNDNFGEQYPYYAIKHNRCKFKNSEESSTWWHLRSEHADVSGGSLDVIVSGLVGWDDADGGVGVSFGFCIG